jgi:hypothetical protein
VRVITATVAVTCADGSVHQGEYRLATTLADARRHPATVLVALYHQHREIEIGFLALRSTMLHGRVLRSGDPQGLRQEMWALLAVYQLLRTAMVDATDAVAGCDPDRASFSSALAAARDTVTRAVEIIPAPGRELVSAVTETVESALLPPRRSRISARTVKGASVRYRRRPDTEGRPRASTPVTALDITVLEPEAAAVVPAAATGYLDATPATCRRPRRRGGAGPAPGPPRTGRTDVPEHPEGLTGRTCHCPHRPPHTPAGWRTSWP